MTTEQKQRTMFVGVDVHKDTHTAVGVSPFGEKLFEITVENHFYYGKFEYPKESGQWYNGAHEPLISKDLFDLV